VACRDLTAVLWPSRKPKTAVPEEERLKALGPEMAAYLARLKSERGHRYVWSLRKLYAVLCQHKAEDVLKAVAKANEHGLFDVGRIEAIIIADLAGQEYMLPMETQDYEDSPEFQKGAGTPPSDLSQYGLEDSPEEDKGNDR